MPKGHKNPFPSIPSLCLCGCNEIVYNGRRYKVGHISREEIVRNKISISNTGKKRTEDFKKQKSIRMSGSKHPMFGKHHSREDIDRIYDKSFEYYKILTGFVPGVGKT